MQTPERFDPLNAIMCCIGAGIFFALWYYDVLSAKIIWKILTTDI